jgi:hypothetical protein
MTTTYLYTYTVNGNSKFPVDMLRHDRCWPASENEALDLQDWLNGRTIVHGVFAVVTFTLRSNQAPTEGRWQSFGWTVAGIEKRKVS